MYIGQRELIFTITNHLPTPKNLFPIYNRISYILHEKDLLLTRKSGNTFFLQGCKNWIQVFKISW